MTDPAQARTEHVLHTSDGVEIAAVHYPQANSLVAPAHGDGLAIIVVHGFSGNRFEERVRKVTGVLSESAGVIAIDLRGHGRSGGKSTVGYLEVLDVEAAVQWARELGYQRIALAGFSMGGSVVVRAAAITRDVDAVVTVSGPAFWYYKGTKRMRQVHRGVETLPGRIVLRTFLRTRIARPPWPEPPPLPPFAAAAQLGSIPLLIVHGDVDRYFPLEHPEAMFRSANDAGVDAQLWIEEGFGHAESAITQEQLRRILAWIVAKTEQA